MDIRIISLITSLSNNNASLVQTIAHRSEMIIKYQYLFSKLKFQSLLNLYKNHKTIQRAAKFNDATAVTGSIHLSNSTGATKNHHQPHNNTSTVLLVRNVNM